MGVASVWSGVKSELGEGPYWSSRTQALVWVDIIGQNLHRQLVGSNAVESWSMPSRIGCAVEWESDFLVGLADGIYRFNPLTGDLIFVADPEPDQPLNRLNDGKCDPRGRFWVGSTRDDSDEEVGGLYRLDLDGRVVQVLEDVVCSNGLGWSPDGRVFYFTDSGPGCIDQFDFDMETGQVSNRRPFAQQADLPGIPDGLCVDSEGYIWSARWDGGCVVRYRPDGRIDKVVDLPVVRPTSCAFGGSSLDRLFITTVTFGLLSSQLTPESGAVLELDVACSGLPTTGYLGRRT
ncbi:MAG: SMP-30/gluconolactonase/LRE family protein [Actinomycetes bacterium]